MLVHGGVTATLVADDPIVPAAEVPVLCDAFALLASADELHAGANDVRAAAQREGYDAGFAAGREAGLASGRAEMSAELFRLAIRDSEDAKGREDEIARLALAVVRRIAGSFSDREIVAALAAQAAAAISPDTAATVRVAPGNLDATNARLEGVAHLAVEVDAKLSPTDCVIETRLGRTDAGLETQLTQIELAWADRRAAS